MTKLQRVGTVFLLLAAGIVAVQAPAAADTGGGCRQTSNAYVCISVSAGTSGPLRADYYIDVRSRGEYRGVAFVEQGGTGDGCYNDYRVGVWQPVAGHSPVYTRGKYCRNARTVVEFYNSSGVFLYSASSPMQYW